MLGAFVAPTSPADVKATSIRYFGDYVLLGEIAGGGMGVVFHARQVSLNRKVAVKLIRAGRMATDDERRRFRTEAEAAARLDHPHIVPIYEIGEHEGQPFIAMKLIEGESLAERLGEVREQRSEVGNQRAAGTGRDAEARRLTSDRCPLTSATALLATIARAVQHAHERGVLHRDIKPGNILLDAAGEPHLTDFGLAKFLGRDTSHTLTSAILGTPDYMSPEQAVGSTRDVTAVSDVYSLGAVLYALLTGQPPFHGQSPGETIEWVKHRAPRPPRALNPRVDAALEIICLKCLEKEPAARYASAQALAEDLDRWLASQPILARPAGRWARLRKWTRRNRVAAALAATMVLGALLVVAGGVWFWPRGEAPHAAASVKWENVSAPALQAEPNRNYRLKSATEVAITLPAAPATGDVIRVASGGSGGWRLIQNSNQVILTENLGAGEAGRHWVNRGGDRQWTGVASSADGTRLVASEFGHRQRGGNLYLSDDGGATWNPRGPKRLWTACALSADAGLIAATTAFAKIYISTNFGQLWHSREERMNWTGIACSADGQKLVAVDNGTNAAGGHIYISTDRGRTWTPRESRRNWYFVASSADGRTLAASVGESNVKGELSAGFIYVSADGGVTWTPRLTDQPRRWEGIAMSADGRTICAVEDNGLKPPGGRFHVSLDAGVTWTARGPVGFWNRIGMSPDARVLIGIAREKVEDVSQLVLSRDLGATWIELKDHRFWSSAAFSADGRRLVAAAGHYDIGRGSAIFTSVPTTVPGLAGAFTGAAGAEVELQYLGGDQFRVLRASGLLTVEGNPAPVRPSVGVPGVRNGATK